MVTKTQSRVIGFWEVDLGLRATEDRNVLDESIMIEDEVGEAHSAGYGFGFRDMQFGVSTPWKAKKLAKELRVYLEHKDDYIGCYYVPPMWVLLLREWFE